MSATDQAFSDIQRIFGQELAGAESVLGPGSRCVFQKTTVTDISASALDLRGGATLIKCTFKNVTFERSDLSEAPFLGCSFESCRFLGCDFEGSCFLFCKLRDVIFEGATSSIDRARFEDCEFSDLRISDV